VRLRTHNTKTALFEETVSLSTALVQHETASSLLRALQTVEDPWDYRIPPEGNELEIDQPPYRLLGWLLEPESRSGIDEKDPSGNQVSVFSCLPGRHTKLGLKKSLQGDGIVRWKSNKGEAVYRMRQWSDRSKSEEERLGNTVMSRGHWLAVNSSELVRIMDKTHWSGVIFQRNPRD